MLLEWLFILFYAALFCLLIRKLHLAERTAIKDGWLYFFFIIRIFSGIFYGWIHYHLYGEVDTWSNFSDSKIIYSALPSQPLVYLKLVFGINSPPPSADISSFAHAMTCWNQPDAYFMVRFQSLCNVFTMANYNVNVVFFNFIVFTGLLHLYSFFKNFIPRQKKSVTPDCFPGTRYFILVVGYGERWFRTCRYGIFTGWLSAVFSRQINRPNLNCVQH